jgi:2-polyprenyl-3-methyl-5-hydroxy-6-metoxy-1,4-benzoquinol methylase
MNEKLAKMKSAHWKEHFQHRHRQLSDVGLAKSLDYSNERVLLQTYSAILEGTGALHRKSVLDAGCGWGSSTLLFYACGADVMGIDIVPETISVLRQQYPFILWQAVDLMDKEAMDSLPLFDCIIATEVLQYVDFEPVVKSLWSHVRPGGRLVGAVPNSKCSIVQEVVKRYSEFWKPVSDTQIRRLTEMLFEVQEVYVKGLTFQGNQHFLPYSASEWDEVVQGTPNRIIFVLIRKS